MFYVKRAAGLCNYQTFVSHVPRTALPAIGGRILASVVNASPGIIYSNISVWRIVPTGSMKIVGFVGNAVGIVCFVIVVRLIV